VVRILLDTNIILRNAIQNDPQHAEVRSALERLARAGWELCIGAQNLVEFWVVATRPTNVNGLGLTPAATRPELDAMRVAYTLLPDPPDLLDQWLELCTRYGVQGRAANDTRLVALMLGHGLTRLLSLNVADFRRYAEITCLVPADV
jgi:predicted nucleic acid-binding protein